jgi:hypothetical protein
MSCSNCYNFSKSKSPKDLGDITDSNSCAYCLYWYAGPGSDRDCNACDTIFENVSNMGTKFDINGFNTVNNCLNIPQNKKDCSHLYTQFNNPPKSEDLPPHFGSRFRDLGRE